MIVTKDGKIIRIDPAKFAKPGRSAQGVRVCAWKKATAWPRHRSFQKQSRAPT